MTHNYSLIIDLILSHDSSSQTGTLTENRMTVVEGWFSGTKFARLPNASELSKELMDNLRINTSLNSKAFLVDSEKGGRIGYIGSSTECALLLALRTWGFDYKEVRAQHESDLVQVGPRCFTQYLSPSIHAMH